MQSEDPGTRRTTIAPRTPLARPVYVMEKLAADCLEDTLLEGFQVDDGPAKQAVEQKLWNLRNRQAWPQTVVFLMEEGTDRLLALASVCLDGDPRRGGWTDPFLTSIAGSPYINLLARDKRCRRCVLRDGRTALSTAVLWGTLEVVLRDRPSPEGELPLVFGFVDEDNNPSLHAFSTVLFEVTKLKRPPDEEAWAASPSGLILPVHQDLAVTREAGLPLAGGRDLEAYRPLVNPGPSQPLRRPGLKPQQTSRQRKRRRGKDRRRK